MDIQVHGTSSLTLIEHATSHVSGVLKAMGSQVQDVHVRLEDVNGPSKGNDKRCLITVRVKHEEPIVVDELNDDMYQAVTNATHRLKNVAAKKHDKRMEKLHGHGH